MVTATFTQLCQKSIGNVASFWPWSCSTKLYATLILLMLLIHFYLLFWFILFYSKSCLLLLYSIPSHSIYCILIFHHLPYSIASTMKGDTRMKMKATMGAMMKQGQLMNTMRITRPTSNSTMTSSSSKTTTMFVHFTMLLFIIPIILYWYSASF